MSTQLIIPNDMLFEDEFVQLEMPYEGDSDPPPKEMEIVFDCFSDELQREAKRRLAYIEWFEKKLSGGWTEKNINGLMNDAASILDAPLPNWRTIVHWRQRYIQHGCKLIALIPKIKEKGNRTKRQNASDELFIKEAIESFLDKKKPSISKVYKQYNDKITVRNYHSDTPIKALEYHSFYKRVIKSPIYKYVSARDGKYKARVEFSSIGAYIPPSYIMERVQIDHTTLDLVLLDDELSIPIGRPSLTVLIDSYSHCVVGFNLSFKQPSYESVRNALINTMHPKDYVQRKYPSVQHEWSCSGKPQTLVVDNGVEFWSSSLESACKDININIQYNPIRKPWLKPLIERFFGIINSSLLSTIPGKTFSNIFEKGDYNPQKEAGMRLSVFLEIFHVWIIDVYHQEADSRQRYIPFFSWEKGYNKLPPAQIIGEELEELYIKLGMSFWAAHRRGGIYKNHLRYDSNELAAFRKNYPASTKGQRKVLVKLNPQDVSYVYVFIDELNKLIRVPCVDPTGYTKNLNLDMHLVTVKLHHDYIGGKVDTYMLSKTRLYINERIEKEIEDVNNLKRAKIKSLNKIAKIRGKGSQIMDKADTVPIAPVMQQEILMGDDSTNPVFEDDWESKISGLEPF